MGKEEVSMRCIKYMMLSITAMFVLTSALIISVGTTIYAIYHDFSYFLAAHFFSPALFIIVIGVMMLFVSVFGCVGAIRESTCLVNIFAMILGVVLILELSAAIAAYALRGSVQEFLDDKLTETLPYYVRDAEVKDAYDFVQSRLSCCGINSYLDWGELGNALDGSGILVNNVTVPDSCCAEYHSTTFGDLEIDTCIQLYANGCLPRVIYLVHGSAGLLGTGALTIAFIQIIGIMFSIMLARAIRRAKSERERRRWEIREQVINAYTNLQPKPVEDSPNPVLYVPFLGQKA